MADRSIRRFVVVGCAALVFGSLAVTEKAFACAALEPALVPTRMLVQARRDLLAGRTAVAREKARSILRDDPQQVGAKVILAIALWRESERESAIEEVRGAYRIDAKATDAELDRVDAVTGARDLRKAVEV